MPLTLTLKTSTTLPIEVEGILPETCEGKSLAEIELLAVFQGKERLPLGEIFTISGSAQDGELRFEGDCQGVHWIGAKMNRGTIRIEGNAGRHLGSQMQGGEITVQGNAGSWLGAEMRSGRIVVSQNAGHQIGAAYRGSLRGMRGGEILIHGDAGNEIGARMRRGLIAIGGRSGDATGYAMLAGTIVLCGEAGRRLGGNMKRGSIVCFSPHKSDLLPTFQHSARLSSGYVTILGRKLARLGFAGADRKIPRTFDYFAGDLLEGGRGEILLAAS